MDRPLSQTVEFPEPTLDELKSRFVSPPSPTVQLDLGALSHPGKVRVNNEDHYAVIRRRRSRDVVLSNLPEGFFPLDYDDAHVLTVADGIGGAAYGEVASMMALRIGWDLVSNSYHWYFKLSEEETTHLMEALRVYGRLIHRKIRERAAKDPMMAGMGTTVTCVVLAGLDAVVAHVGDSRAYRFRDGSLKLLTRDHTLAQQLLDTGVITSLENASGFLRNVLTNCLGGKSPDVRIETHPFRLKEGDSMLLCTDGLTDMVTEEDIARILSEHAVAQNACQALVDQALANGGKDNVTVVIARCTDVHTKPRSGDSTLQEKPR